MSTDEAIADRARRVVRELQTAALLAFVFVIIAGILWIPVGNVLSNYVSLSSAGGHVDVSPWFVVGLALVGLFTVCAAIGIWAIAALLMYVRFAGLNPQEHAPSDLPPRVYEQH